MESEPTKVILRRGIAFLIDTIPGVVLYRVLIGVFGEKVGQEPGTQLVIETEVINGDARVQIGRDVWFVEGGDLMLVTVLMLVYWIGIFVIWQGLNGATLGKSLLGIRTVRPDGRPCGIGRAAARWLLLIVDAFFYLFPVVGLVTALASRGNRRVGDMAADTYVVKASFAGRPIPLGAGPVPPPGPPPRSMRAFPPATTAGPVPGPPAGTPPPPTQPQWDPVRNTHVCWDPHQQTWLQWDAAQNRWVPIS